MNRNKHKPLIGLSKLLIPALAAIAIVLAVFCPPARGQGNLNDTSPDNIVAVVLRDGYPCHFYDEKTGKASGFAIEIMDIVAKRAGLQVTYIYGANYAELISRVSGGGADVIPSVAITDVNDDLLDFTRPLDSSPLFLFVRTKNDTVKGLASGLEVGVARGTRAHELLRSAEDIDLKVYSSFSELLFALLSGQIDAFMASEATTIGLAQKAGVRERIKAVGPPYGEVKRAIAVRQGNTRLLSRLESAADGLIGSPEYEKAYKKWYGRSEPYWTAKRIFTASAISLFATVCIMFLWRHFSILKFNRELKHEIDFRKQSEKALQESEERFRGAFETAVIGMSIISLDGHLLKVNPALCRILGYPEQELLAMTSRDLTHPDDFEINLAFSKLLLNGEIPYYHLEKRCFHKQGHLVRTLLSVSLVHDVNGGPIYFVGLIEDITQRKKAEDSLRESEAKYRSLIESTEDSIYLIDRDCKYVFMNEKHLARLGLARDVIREKTYGDFHSPEEAGEFAGIVAGVFKTGEPFRYEYQSRRDNRYFLRTISPVKGPDRDIIAATVISKDITNFKAAEEERKRLNTELDETLSKIKALSGLLPICASCKKIRDDGGYWNQIETYISKHSDVDFTHAICPECAQKLYPEYYKEVWEKEER